MKKTIHILFALLATIIASCSEEYGNPTFGDDELYIYYSSWAATATVSVGGTYAKNDVVVSPADGSVSCCWTLDGTVISTELAVAHTFPAAGRYELRFEAKRGSAVNSRTVTITVE